MLKPKGIVLSVISMITLSTSAQTEFDNDGRLIKIETDAGKISLPHLSKLDSSAGAELKQVVRDMLLEKAEEATRIFTSNHYKRSLHQLYLFLWKTDSTQLTRYLDSVTSTLKSGTISSTNPPLMKGFDSAFVQNLSDTTEVFRWRYAAESSSGELRRKKPFESFVVDYYNATLKPAVDSNVILKKEDIVEHTYYLANEQLQVRKLLKRYRDTSKLTIDLFDSLANVHKQLHDSNSTFTSIIHTFRKPWYQQWFWFRGGEIRLNPLDFGTEDTVRKYPWRDVTKNLENIDAENGLFKTENRLDTLSGLFRESLKTLSYTDNLLNKITVPPGKHFNYSATGKIKYSVDEDALIAELRPKEKKTIVIHNIPLNRTAALKEDATEIEDKSAFEIGLQENVVKPLTELAAAYAKFTPYGAVLDFFGPSLKQTTASIKPKQSQQQAPVDITALQSPNKFVLEAMGTMSADSIAQVNEEYIKAFLLQLKTLDLTYIKLPYLTGADTLKNNLRAALFDKEIMDTDLFEQTFKNNITIQKLNKLINRRTKDSTKYHEVLKQFRDTLSLYMGNLIKRDSFYVAGLLNIYNNSSFVKPQKLKIKEDDNSQFHTAIKETTPSDKASEHTVKPFTIIDTTDVQKQDTAFISKFTYKSGQYKRVALGAGLAYTLNSYNQSLAKEENGSLKITNNTRQYRFVFGLHYYIGKGLYSQDNTMAFSKKRHWCERISAFVGVGIPDPLGNLYTGFGLDFVPGLKLTGGVHFAKFNKYLIQNNTIVEERLRYQLAGPFIALNIDPTVLVSILNVFTTKPDK